MDKLFFFVNLDDNFGFHRQFFIEENAFILGLIIAFVIGAFVAAAFYFGCCNSKKNLSMATIPAWIIALFLAGALTYLTIDFCVIGRAKTTDDSSLFRTHSFYVSMEHYYQNEYETQTEDMNQLQEVLDEKTKIAEDLDAGKDQRLPFDFGCVAYSVLFFYIVSIVIKGMTSNGAAIPHKWPN